MQVDGQLKGAQLEEIASAAPSLTPRSRIYSDITNPSQAIPRFYTGSAWTKILTEGDAGGISGVGANWYPVQGAAPLEDEEFNRKVWKFTPGLAEQVSLTFKVPTAYVAGQRIRVRVGVYSPAASGTFLYQTVSTLVRKDVDAMDSTTNQRTSTNAALTNTLANMYREMLCDLTDATGLINSVAVAGGDSIKIILQLGTGTDVTSITRFVPDLTEIVYG